ncbi:uncharacterized protein BP5553_09119 [Venustampulla echinocandica]|uniref:Uncharacterized protein n=1 Tax=Venustampulla echinocandica TaxID=2656787 RepID=A0A370TDW8_9HELO|nr:uncharacterized protein BP5553_09119 [Venustampulla echinocandica]RDL32663.1 hypothetical protein BP5553_09119 [Venustampulla echinocandica]
MASLNNQLATRIVNDDRPVALRRKRRGSVEPTRNSVPSSSRSQPKASQTASGISTPPETPKREKKRVRFSDPCPEIQTESSSSGLTPFFGRSSLGTPASNRRHSTPAALWNRAEYNLPVSGTLQFAPLRQVLDGRIKRRLKRNRLSEEINIIEYDKRHEARARKTEVERLRQELAAKDQEVQTLMDEQEVATQIEEESGLAVSVNIGSAQSARIQELEQVISELRSELRRKEEDPIQSPNWTMAARDPFNFDNDDNVITNYDDNFGDSDMLTTPTRLNTSFPSPPSTVPNTPCRLISSTSAGVQACLPIPDPENDTLKSQLDSLRAELAKLTSAIALKEDNHLRIAEKLSEFFPVDESCDYTKLDFALDTVLTQLAVAQSDAKEHLFAFSALSTEITGLGFPLAGPEETLKAIATQFRRARLDLEYLTPGEVVEGFENDKLLDMLVSRVGVLLAKAKEQESTIDEYHEQEVLLRQQLNTRVSVADDLHREISHVNRTMGELRGEMEEKDISNQRLQSALEGYRKEVIGLEKLIENMEAEGRRQEAQWQSEATELQGALRDEMLKHDTTRASEQGKNMIIIELEHRLAAALQAASKVQTQLATHVSTKDAALANKDATIELLKSTALQREKEHGKSLALCDARVCELQSEVERVNEALKAAHHTIIEIRKDNQALEAQVEGEKKREIFVVRAIGDQLTRALEAGTGFTNGDISVLGPIRSQRAGSAPVEGEHSIVTQDQGQRPVRRAGLFDGELARRRSGKKRRRYDSGLGFLDEADEGNIEM